MKYVTLNSIKPKTRFPIKAKSVLRYVELKSGYSDNGPAWIGYVKQSKTGRTLYFDGRGLMKLKGSGAVNRAATTSIWRLANHFGFPA